MQGVNTPLLLLLSSTFFFAYTTHELQTPLAEAKKPPYYPTHSKYAPLKKPATVFYFVLAKLHF